MVFWQPDTNAAPLVMGFVSTNETVGNYFGPNIFAGTPFETAPTLTATFDITINDSDVGGIVTLGDLHVCILRKRAERRQHSARDEAAVVWEGLSRMLIRRYGVKPDEVRTDARIGKDLRII